MGIGFGFFSSIKNGLLKTSSKISNGIRAIVGSSATSAKTIEDLEDLLVGIDVGIEESSIIAKNVFNRVGHSNKEDLTVSLRDEIAKMLDGSERNLIADGPLNVIVFCGINGAGKTTTVGKIAYKFRAAGKTVLLAACDTFRAAAIEQLKIWSDRADCDIFYEIGVQDASSVAYKAACKAITEGYDVLLIDTAGRLHNQENFIAELEKLNRTLKKVNAAFPHKTIMVMDATIGQVALEQLKVFRDRVGVDGLMITKLDGTAKGGVVLSAFRRYGIGIYAIGLGEQVEDLVDFNADAFASGLVGIENDS